MATKVMCMRFFLHGKQRLNRVPRLLKDDPQPAISREISLRL
jgi:hypothetical protein